MSTRISRDTESALQAHARKSHLDTSYQEAWRNLPELPSADEIKPPRDEFDAANYQQEEWNDYQHDPLYDPKLPKNRIEGSWPTKEAYIGTHYQILREDAVAPLRNSVAAVHKCPTMEDDGDTCIYTHVTFTGLQLSRQGVASRVEFSTERAGKQIRWEQSKRLMQGTVVALTPARDMFTKVVKIAVVAARRIKGGLDQNPPTVDLFWADSRDIALDPVEKYVMVEARQGYFEASRFMLVAMQKLMTEEFRLARYLTDMNPDVKVPPYLQDKPFLNLSSLKTSLDESAKSNLIESDRPEDAPLYRRDVINDFPKNIKCDMDASQMKACESMLTKEIAIVQGPPGTGKTFVSVSALKVMVENLGPDDPPIIVTAQTNHALDQLLNHIMDFESRIVRLGGRSDRSNKEIRLRTFYELRKANPFPGGSAGMKMAGMDHNAVCEEILETLQPLRSNRVLTAETLVKEGLITDCQRASLNASDWEEDEEAATVDIVDWLTNNQLMPITGAPVVNLGLPLEESDIEFEQLLELEMMTEAGGLKDHEEEEDTGLGGLWVPFKRTFTGRHDSVISDRKIKKLLLTCKDLYKIPAATRGEVYRYFEQQTDASMLRVLHQKLRKYDAFVADYSVTRSRNNIKLMQHLDIKVIGCTTTGLSKYRGLLSALQPRTLLIEEAAETLEGKIIGGMFESLEQLILVGDHQQLQASCTVRALEDEPYYLKVSMFERLINNAMPFVMLNKQRRMIPDVRKLLCIEPKPFYDNLQDHASVLDRVNRPPVPGMGGLDTYFFHHTWPEASNADCSKYNADEAEMIAGFFNYLVQNGTEASKITVLTFYNGQRKTILRELKKHPSLGGNTYFKVFTVDSYQGEENDIILLSLVRSNQNFGVGFLDNKNRLVVALSRARRGLYVFGNAVTLTYAESNDDFIDRDPMWDSLIMFMKDQRRFDFEKGLPITCARHGTRTNIMEAQDWMFNAGGCSKLCGAVLPCGHTCPHPCHPYPESRVLCKDACEKQLPCGHGCSRQCAELCHCDVCNLPLGLPIADWNGGAWDDVPSSALSSSSKSTARSSGSSDQQRVQVGPTLDMRYTASDVRRSMPSPNPSQHAKRRGGKSRSSRSSQQTSSPSKADRDALKVVWNKLPKAQPRIYGEAAAIVDEAIAQTWSKFDAKQADAKLSEESRLRAAKSSDDQPQLVIQETFRPMIIKDGVRMKVPSGPVRTIHSRSTDDNIPTSAASPKKKTVDEDKNSPATQRQELDVKRKMIELTLQDRIVPQKKVSFSQDLPDQSVVVSSSIQNSGLGGIYQQNSQFHKNCTDRKAVKGLAGSPAPQAPGSSGPSVTAQQYLGIHAETTSDSRPSLGALNRASPSRKPETGRGIHNVASDNKRQVDSELKVVKKVKQHRGEASNTSTKTVTTVSTSAVASQELLLIDFGAELPNRPGATSVPSNSVPSVENLIDFD